MKTFSKTVVQSPWNKVTSDINSYIKRQMVHITGWRFGSVNYKVSDRNLLALCPILRLCFGSFVVYPIWVWLQRCLSLTNEWTREGRKGSFRERTCVAPRLLVQSWQNVHSSFSSTFCFIFLFWMTTLIRHACNREGGNHNSCPGECNKHEHVKLLRALQRAKARIGGR